MKLKVYLPQSACKTIYVSITRDPEMPLLCQEWFIFVCVCVWFIFHQIFNLWLQYIFKEIRIQNFYGGKNNKMNNLIEKILFSVWDRTYTKPSIFSYRYTLFWSLNKMKMRLKKKISNVFGRFFKIFSRKNIKKIKVSLINREDK